VTVTLSDGRTERADILVAADGAYSHIRQMAFGNDHHPLYAGQGVWRYTVPRPKTLDGFTIFRAEGGAASVGCLPLAEDLAYFFILESPVEPVRVREAELAARLSERLAPYSAPELVEARAMVGEDRHISFRRFDILLMPQPWHRGRIVLLGDSAHSLTPQLTSGGGMAVEDSVVLADELDGCTDIERAFTAYGQRREGRVRPIYDNSLRICELEKGHPSDATEAVTLFVESFKLLAAHY
jgi:2-polyprenyl-6-methoxyphenol hydroxylase-like FAD-dependent oxidoreductase